MAGRMAMASEFSFPSLPTANWFPGHMAKATRMLRNRIPHCDCIIEVHDARVLLKYFKQQTFPYTYVRYHSQAETPT